MTDQQNTPLAYPVLVADIGGTNARFGVISDQHAEVKLFGNVKTSDYASLEEAIQSCVLDKTSLWPKGAVIAIAGPVSALKIDITNCDWEIEPENIIKSVGLSDLVIINDFEAVALALPALGKEQLIQLGGESGVHNASRFALGPGTGLGASGLIYSDHTWIPIPSEIAHTHIGPEGERQTQIWPHLTPAHGRITAESVLSGPGLLNLYQAICATDGVSAETLSAPDIANAATNGNAQATEAIAIFSAILGRLAGDGALTFMATGGVYLSGGIPRKIAKHIEASNFREMFENKSPHEDLVKRIPVYLIIEEYPAFIGVAAYARMPRRFGLHLDDRRWSA